MRGESEGGVERKEMKGRGRERLDLIQKTKGSCISQVSLNNAVEQSTPTYTQWLKTINIKYCFVSL